jgi:ubiquinone/menaquinone biosynthesis C-methylase UbiE
MSLEDDRNEWESKHYFEERMLGGDEHCGKRFYEEFEKTFRKSHSPNSQETVHVLDVGCKSFNCWSEDIKNQANVNLVGLDISKMALSRYQRRIGESRKPQPVLSVAQYIPFKENSFDEFVCIETLMYARHDYKKVLDELARILKNEGNGVLTFYHKDFAQKQNLPIKDIVTEYTNMSKIRHIAVFNENDVEKILDDLKLDIKKRITYTLGELNGSSNIPQETKAVIYVECKKQK